MTLIEKKEILPQMNKQLYVDALLDGLGEGNADLEQAKRLCGFPLEGNQPALLESILGKIGGADISRQFIPGRLTLEKEKAADSVFAHESVEASPGEWFDEARKGLAVLQQAFANRQDSAAYRYTLYHFMHAYGARVAYRPEGQSADASLFDRNRVLAAVSQCLEHTGGEAKFLLLKGAVSGIQTYIYNDIKAEQAGEADKASKKLRGRSFLVEFINQVVSESIVEQLSLEQANILFVGGGQFAILLPDTNEIQQKLPGLLKEINLGLLERVGMHLGLITAWASCSGNLAADFARYYSEVNKKLEASKFKKHQQYLVSFFEQFENSGRLSNNEEEEKELGARAPYARYILEVSAESESALIALSSAIDEKRYRPAICSLGFLKKHFYIVKEEEEQKGQERAILLAFLEQYEPLFSQNGLSLKISALNEPDLLGSIHDFSSLNLEIAFGFRFFGNEAPIYPTKEGFAKEATAGSVMLFEDLARLNEDGAPGLAFEQLGVMRLDVDDLGAIFAAGLEGNASMERLLCLSREFQLFFGGYFNLLAERRYIYVTYSGGDDAFVIGSWINTLNFAQGLEEAFRKFTCGNKKINFSSGIFLCSPHYPVPRLAREAARLEKKAKSYPKEAKEVDKDKNALHVFNHTLPWDRFGEAMRFSTRLIDAVREIQNQRIRRSLLQRFLRIIQSTREDDFQYYRQVASLHNLMARQGFSRQKIEGDEKLLSGSGKIVKELLAKMKASREEFNDYTIPLHIALYQSKND